MVEAMGVPGCRVRGVGDLGGGLVLSVERRRRGGRCPACGRPSRAGHGRRAVAPGRSAVAGTAGAAGVGGATAAVRERGLPAPDLRGAGPLLGDPQGAADASPGRGATAGSGSRTGRRGGRAAGAGAGRCPRAPPRCCGGQHAAPVPRRAAPGAVGTGGWAWREGRSRGTLVVDLERRRPLDLLPDRSGPTLGPRGRAAAPRSRSRPGSAPRNTREPWRRARRASGGGPLAPARHPPGGGALAGTLPRPPATPARRRSGAAGPAGARAPSGGPMRRSPSAPRAGPESRAA